MLHLQTYAGLDVKQNLFSFAKVKLLLLKAIKIVCNLGMKWHL